METADDSSMGKYSRVNLNRIPHLVRIYCWGMQFACEEFGEGLISDGVVTSEASVETAGMEPGGPLDLVAENRMIMQIRHPKKKKKKKNKNSFEKHGGCPYCMPHRYSC